MKKGIFLTFILAILATGMVFVAYQERSDYLAAQDEYARKTGEIEERRGEIEEKQSALDAMEVSDSHELFERAAALESEAEAIKGNTTAIDDEVNSLKNLEAEKQQELEALREEQSYYLEVYDAIKEGYEKVLGYISGN